MSAESTEDRFLKCMNAESKQYFETQHDAMYATLEAEHGDIKGSIDEVRLKKCMISAMKRAENAMSAKMSRNGQKVSFDEARPIINDLIAEFSKCIKTEVVGTSRIGSTSRIGGLSRALGSLASVSGAVAPEFPCFACKK
jgi:hypothetical protein